MKNGLFEAEGKRFYNSVKEFDGRKGKLFTSFVVYACNLSLSKNNYNSVFQTILNQIR